MLNSAPKPGQSYNLITNEVGNRVEQEALLRAVRVLHRRGLIEVRSIRNWRRGIRQLGVRLSPIGAEVVERCRDELVAGRRIRWSRRIPKIIDALRLHGTELVAVFETRMREHIDVMSLHVSVVEESDGGDDRVRVLRAALAIAADARTQAV